MKTRIWTYILVFVVFVLPICTVTAMKLEPQGELRGAGGHCKKTCVSTPVRGSCGDGCGDGDCVDWLSYNDVTCEDGKDLISCRTERRWIASHVRGCTCDDPEFPGVCKDMGSLGTGPAVRANQCVDTTPC